MSFCSCRTNNNTPQPSNIHSKRRGVEGKLATAKKLQAEPTYTLDFKKVNSNG
jgi:hypothetical protein